MIVLLPEEAYIIGSILEEGNFYAFSDIDIAVRGLKDGYSKVYGDSEEMVGRSIDLKVTLLPSPKNFLLKLDRFLSV